MKHILTIILVCLVSCSTLSAQSNADEEKAKMYRDYTEAYRKAAASNEQATIKSERSAHVSWVILGLLFVFLGVVTAKVQKRQKRYFDGMVAIAKENQKVLEEIRDSLRK
jgi:hypothetical protein